MAARIDQKRRFAASGALHCSLFAMIAVYAVLEPGLAQARKPISKSGLLEAVKLNGLSTQELIQQVEQRGVSFRLTSGDEQEFRQAGARPELIEAIRANYRPAEPIPNPAPSTGSGSAARSTGVPAGAPLSKNEIITMLQSEVPPSRVEKFVEARGVDFTLTPDIAKAITAAGGTRSLVGAITEKGPSTAPRAEPASNLKTSAAQYSGPAYEDLTDQATAALQSNNAASAVGLLQQAIRLNPAQPTAYALLGYAQLYGYRNIGQAEQPMRAAIERGGGAVFRIYHDHDGFFKTYCTGSFFVTKTGVTFKGDNGAHAFEAHKVDMKEVKLNGFVGSQYGAFHIKLGSQNYNFAPATTNRAESNLIINLIQGFQ